MARVFGRDASPRFLDFLEIASYVFCGDCASQRGIKWTDDDSAEPWSRDLAFVIAVREPEFWDRPKIKRLIEDVLCFLSGDKYSFVFVQLERDHSYQQYFNFTDQKEWPFYGPERVMMFSGGLDSLAGAVETARAGKKLVLVSHRPVSILDARQKRLFRELAKKFPGQAIHIPVWINKSERFGREATQRTRSFLFTALGALVSHSVGSKGLRFYENGVVSLNLPIAQEAVGARASRTTHPMSLHLLSCLCKEVAGTDFVVDNPFFFNTKAEVVNKIAEHGTAELVAHTCSCSHLMFRKTSQRHCGVCSQCVDRRFAVAAAGLLKHDVQTDYTCDVFLGPRGTHKDKAIAVDYTQHAIELDRRTQDDLASAFNAEISRAVRYEPKRNEAAQKILSMYKRHGTAVRTVLEQLVRENASGLVEKSLPPTSLLALAIGQRYLLSQQPDRVESADTPLVASINNATLARMEEKLDTIVAKFDSRAERHPLKKKSRPTRRDCVLFAAILMQLKGSGYCRYLDRHNVKPKWTDTAPHNYETGYLKGQPWAKKVQDEKARANQRMRAHEDSNLADAFNRYLPEEFANLSSLLNSRNSRGASKKLTGAQPA